MNSYIPILDCQIGVQNAVDMTIRAHEQAVCIPENPRAAQLPAHTRPAGRARISLLSQVPTGSPIICDTQVGLHYVSASCTLAADNHATNAFACPLLLAI